MRKNSEVCYGIVTVGNGSAKSHQKYYMDKKSVLQKIVEFSIVQLFKLRGKVDKRDRWGWKYVDNLYGENGEMTKIRNYVYKKTNQPFPFCKLEEEDWM